VKEKLVRGVSIGFRALEYSYIDGGGIRFRSSAFFSEEGEHQRSLR